MTKTKVRFHLAQGPNFKKWQVRCGESVEYYDPFMVSLQMKVCKLRNQPATAEKIFAGDNKTVCAWIECDEVVVLPASLEGRPKEAEYLYYNPKKKPYWHDQDGNNKDLGVFDKMFTSGPLVATIE
jgi:hypothetical protein